MLYIYTVIIADFFIVVFKLKVWIFAHIGVDMWREYWSSSMLQDCPHREVPQALPAWPEPCHEEKRTEGGRNLDGWIQTQHQLGLELAIWGTLKCGHEEQMMPSLLHTSSLRKKYFPLKWRLGILKPANNNTKLSAESRNWHRRYHWEEKTERKVEL